MSVLLWLVACGAEVPPSPSPTAAVPPPAAPPPAAPSPAVEDPAIELLGVEGFGAVRFGMDRDEVEQALGRPLGGDSVAGCHVLRSEAGVSYLFDEGRLRRVDVSTARVEVEAGGRVGMSADQIRARYPGLVEQPHKYVEGAWYLTVAGPAVGDGKLVFETDAAGRVIVVRAGLSPQVDYVESCS